MAESTIIRQTYPVVAWIPLAALLFMWGFRGAIARTAGDGVILLGLLVALSSLILGCIGALLIATGRTHHERRLPVIVSTIGAFVPVVVYLWLVLTQH